MTIRRATILSMIFALSANAAAPCFAGEPTLAQKVDTLNASIAKANAQNRPVLLAILRDVEAQAALSSTPLISKTEAKAGVISSYYVGFKAGTDASIESVKSAADIAQDCRNLAQVVTSTSGASAFIENTHHMHIAQGFVALLPVLYMIFHKAPACDKPISLTGSRGFGITNTTVNSTPSDLDNLLNELGLSKPE